MIKRIITLCLSILTLVPLAAAHGHMSAATRLAMHQHRSPSSRMPHSADRVRVFITTEPGIDLGALRQLGVNVEAHFNTMLTASVPISSLRQVCRQAGVRQVSVSQLTELCNDSSRIDARVEPLAEGRYFDRAFDGHGVVVGIIDTGVDFNHINFCDEQGRSRVAAAYLPQDTTGLSPVIDGDTLPGSHYDTPEAIALLTTDDTTASHGTHTTGTAAGSYRGNGLHGMAPAATLVICAMPELYDTDIANSIKYIFSYADRMGMPAVINMSFSSSDGPHDGTSPLCRLFDEVSGPGRLLVISAHNSGLTNLHLTRSFKSATDTLSTTIGSYAGGYNHLVSMWSSPGHRHRVALTLVDIVDKKLLIETPFFDDLDADSVMTIDTQTDTLWSQYVSGVMQFAMAVEEGDRTHSILLTTAKPLKTSRYRLGLKIIADTDSNFNAWVSGGGLFQRFISNQTAGTKVGSINDLATGDQAISVGAYIAKSQYVQAATGQSYTVSSASPLGGIAYFSAWGPDQRGLARPDICAPGMVTISSANRHAPNSVLVNVTNLSLVETVNGIDYPYGASYGTSMSAPVVTGTMALWLQAQPDLTPDEVRDILDHTAVRDAHVLAGDARQWGRGKLDADAGMRYLLNSQNRYDINADGTVDVADLNIIINAILNLPGDNRRADVTGDGTIDVNDINTLINYLLKN